MPGSTPNRTLQLIFFPECPGYELVKAKLRALRLTDVEEINSLTLPIGHPYQGFSSPSLIWNHRVLLGSKVSDERVLSCSYFLDAEVDRALEVYLK